MVQHEQKKFMQQHKVRMESYQKAVSTMKKQRKKKATPENTEKELRVSVYTCLLMLIFDCLNDHDHTNIILEPTIVGGSEEETRYIL